MKQKETNDFLEKKKKKKFRWSFLQKLMM